MVDDREVAFRLARAMAPHTFVDGREIVEHFKRTVDAVFQMTQDIADAVLSNPERRDIVARGLDSEDCLAEGFF